MFRRRKEAPRVFGAHIENSEELVKRLQKRWNGHHVIESLKYKLREYEAQYGVFDENKNRHGDTELAILQKVVEDGEVAESMQPSERATLHILQHGLRDYIDFALDELGRHARVVHTVTDEEGFVWSRQGDPSYNPGLKCSVVENAVGSDMDRTSPPKPFTELSSRLTEFGEGAWWFTDPAPGARPFSAADKKELFEKDGIDGHGGCQANVFLNGHVAIGEV
ncbi:unnamed protein product [Effrenium voratum]|uniref:Uncharacterized protein n=1 Tax=Effrenium voratum TaxID=2562239 RepID=A0AA36N5H9_9DINO|nr:unnamed protein product [Effrenium voratum]